MSSKAALIAPYSLSLWGNSSKVSSTTFTSLYDYTWDGFLGQEHFLAGDLIILVVAADNTGTGTAATATAVDTLGHVTMAQCSFSPIITPGKAAAAGAVLYVFWGIMTADDVGFCTITFSTAITAKAMAAVAFRGVSRGFVDLDTPGVPGFGPTEADWLVSYATDAGPTPGALSLALPADGMSHLYALASETEAVSNVDVQRGRFTGSGLYMYGGTYGGGLASNMGFTVTADNYHPAPSSSSYSYQGWIRGDACAVLMTIKAVDVGPPYRRRNARQAAKALLTR